MQKPEQLISIIVAVLNGKKTLGRCIESIVSQTYPHKELIIIDGGSTDGSVEMLQYYDAKIKYWESKPDKGIYNAWNKGLEHAEGEWICFIGSDDFFFDDKVIEKSMNHLEMAQKRGINYVYGKVGVFSHDIGKIVSYTNFPWPRMRKMIQRGRFLYHSGSFHHRNLFKKHGKFNENYIFAGDYDFIWREVKDHDALYMDMVTICMGHGGKTMSLVNTERMLKEAIVVYKKNNIGIMPVFLISLLVKVKLYMLLRKLIGKKMAYYLSYYFSVLRGKAPIEWIKWDEKD